MKPAPPPWSAFNDVDEAEDRLARGEFVWASTGRTGILSDYGLALVPEQWLRSNWPAELEILEVGGRPYGQTIVVARRRPVT